MREIRLSGSEGDFMGRFMGGARFNPLSLPLAQLRLRRNGPLWFVLRKKPRTVLSSGNTTPFRDVVARVTG